MDLWLVRVSHNRDIIEIWMQNPDAATRYFKVQVAELEQA